MKNNISIIIIVLTISGMLILSDNIELAYAVTIVSFVNEGTTTQKFASHVERLNNVVFVSGDSTGDRVNTYTAVGGDSSNLAFLTAITCADCQQLWVAGMNERVYTRTNNPTPSIHELDANGLFITRTLTTSCNTPHPQTPTLPSDADVIICPDGTNDQIDIVDVGVNPMSKTDGGSINSGAFACDSPTQVFVSGTDDIAFVGCQGLTDRIAVLDSLVFTDAQSPIGGVDLPSPFNFAYSPVTNNLIVCDGDNDLRLYNWNGTALNLIIQILDGDCASSSGGTNIIYNSQLETFFVWDIVSTEHILNIDTNDGDILDTITVGLSLVGLNKGISRFSDNEFWSGVGDDDSSAFQFFKFNTVGLQTGSAGTGGGGTIEDDDIIGGINCSLPENANILICRLGGDNNFGGIGNATGTGLLNLGCNVIFVDCTDTNPQTNGLGLLAFIASLFVIIGMFYYAMGKEAFHMPIFIWIVIVVALSAFFTITGWIDPIFLILSIVAIVALAAPKIISVTRGSTFGGGSTE